MDEQLKNKALAPQKEMVQLLNVIARQNEDILEKLDANNELAATLIEVEERKSKKLDSMDKRQAKSDKVNLPFVVFGSFAAYCGLHVYVYGQAHLKAMLNWLYDSLIGVFI